MECVWCVCTVTPKKRENIKKTREQRLADEQYCACSLGSGVHVFAAVSDSCDPMDCIPPGSSVHEISQARILESVAISFSRGSSRPRNQIRVSCKSPGLQVNSLPLSLPPLSLTWSPADEPQYILRSSSIMSSNKLCLMSPDWIVCLLY